jgi:proteasome accessory factor C
MDDSGGRRGTDGVGVTQEANGTGGRARTPAAARQGRPANAIDQTRRMLSLVTYLRERPGARVGDVARAFGVTEDELISDLAVLPMCGTSFRGGDLLDIDTDGEHIWWRNPGALAAEAAEPLRLAADEATALLVAARAVATLPGLRESDRQALLRATAKLETAAGEAAGASSRVSVTFEAQGSVFADVDRALATRRRLWIRYYSPARDEITEREIDPIRLVSIGHTYVEAWCRRSEARRTFRLDRVTEIKILDEPSEPPEVELRDLSAGLVQPAAGDPEVVVEVGPGGRWVAEYYPHDSAEELPGGGLRISLRTPEPSSLRRLALRLGGDGRIVAPRALADIARETAAAALAAYEEAAAGEEAPGEEAPGTPGPPHPRRPAASGTPVAAPAAARRRDRHP